jgi:hypothetical protein
MTNTTSRWSVLVLSFSILFGAIVRFTPTIISGSPINDGGMFSVMIQDLESNHFIIPSFTTFNHLNIPFTYPPFSFYVGGFLNLAGIPILDLMRWLPPVISTLSIFAFYLLASLIFDSRIKAALASAAYALMPRTFSWYVMGGGLSRTFGVLFLLLSCAAIWKLFTTHEKKYIILAILSGAGAVLSHPETALHTLASCLLIWYLKGRDPQNFRRAGLVVLGIILITSPWIVTVLSQHGIAPYLSALHSGGHDLLFWVPWITFDFAEERFVTLLTVLGFTGLILLFLRRDWFLIAWLFLPFFVEPRSATAIAAIPLAMAAGIGLSDFVIPNIGNIVSKKNKKYKEWTDYMANERIIRIVLGYVLFSALIGGLFYDFSLSHYSIPINSRIAMDWVRNNIPDNGRFIVLTGGGDPFSDPIVEWFPAITSRRSQNTIQGKEWLLGAKFKETLTQTEVLQSCVNDTPSCIEDWATKNQIVFDYLFIEKSSDLLIPRLLLYEIKQDDQYPQIFENESAAIFEHK